MVRRDQTIRIYRRIAKKRYLKGKHVYEHLRIYVPIPSRFHKIIKPFLNQRLKIEVVKEDDGVVIILHPKVSFQSQ